MCCQCWRQNYHVLRDNAPAGYRLSYGPGLVSVLIPAALQGLPTLSAQPVLHWSVSNGLLPEQTNVAPNLIASSHRH